MKRAKHPAPNATPRFPFVLSIQPEKRAYGGGLVWSETIGGEGVSSHEDARAKLAAFASWWTGTLRGNVSSLYTGRFRAAMRRVCTEPSCLVYRSFVHGKRSKNRCRVCEGRESVTVHILFHDVNTPRVAHV